MPAVSPLPNTATCGSDPEVAGCFGILGAHPPRATSGSGARAFLPYVWPRGIELGPKKRPVVLIASGRDRPVSQNSRPQPVAVER